jgi:hypothetical protein
VLYSSPKCTMLSIFFFTNIFLVHVFAMNGQIVGSLQRMSMRNVQLIESPQTQMVTVSSHPIATVEVQYNSLYISGDIEVTQFMTITSCVTAVQSWNNPAKSTTVQSWNTSVPVPTVAHSLSNPTAAFQSRNESVSDLYHQPTLPTSISTQTFNINESYPAFISANDTTVWTNTSSSSGSMIASSLITDHGPTPNPKFSPISSSTAKPYTLAGSGVPFRLSAFSISIQLSVALMQILLLC